MIVLRRLSKERDNAGDAMWTGIVPRRNAVYVAGGFRRREGNFTPGPLARRRKNDTESFRAQP